MDSCFERWWIRHTKQATVLAVSWCWACRTFWLDLLAIVVVLCRRWTQHTLLGQISAQTKVIIKNYYCGSTGWTKGTPTFFPTPCPPVALLRRLGTQEDQTLIHCQPQPHAPAIGSRRESSSRCLLFPMSFLLLAAAANPLPLPCLPRGKVPLHYSESCGGRWLRLRPELIRTSTAVSVQD